MLNKLGKQMRDLAAQRRSVVENQSLSGDQKKEIVDRITAERLALAQQVAPFEEFF